MLEICFFGLHEFNVLIDTGNKADLYGFQEIDRRTLNCDTTVDFGHETINAIGSFIAMCNFAFIRICIVTTVFLIAVENPKPLPLQRTPRDYFPRRR